MANSGTIDPTGAHGGPIVATNGVPDLDTAFSCTWPTMQEVLEDAGVSWKVYSPSSRRQRHVLGARAVRDVEPGAV